MDINPNTGVNLSYPVSVVMATRWEWAATQIELIRKSRDLLQKIVDADLYLADERAKLERRGTLTIKGLTDALLALAKKEFVGAWRSADQDVWRAIPRMIDAVKQRMLPVADKTDMAAAVRRSDIRRLWMALDLGPRMGLLANPTQELAQALGEVPGALLGLSETEAAVLQTGLGENQFPVETAQLTELQDFQTFVGVIFRMVQGDVSNTLGNTRGLDAATSFETLVWGGPLPVQTTAFRLGRIGENRLLPGVTSGADVDVVKVD